MDLRPLRSAISAAYLESEESVATERMRAARLSPSESAATRTLAHALVTRLRTSPAHKRGIDAFMQRGQRITGLETHFTDLDEMTSGFQKSDLHSQRRD